MPVEIIESDKPTKPGFYRMAAETYHADPCPEPSLSSSIAKLIAFESARHAWAAHPRLNKDMEREEFDAKKAVGQAIHKMALGHGAEIARISGAASYQSNAAKAARDDALNAKKIPLLDHQYVDAEKIADPLRWAAEEFMGCPMDEALTEIVVVWKIKNRWCRAMVDCVTPDLLRPCDLKSTATSLAPSSLTKFVYNMNYHLQLAHYTEGLDALDPENMGRRAFALIFGETSSPFLTSAPVFISEAGQELGRRHMKNAGEAWDIHLAAGTDPENWPGFSPFPIIAEPPPWLVNNISHPGEE